MRTSALLVAAMLLLSNCAVVLFPVRLAAGATVGAVDAVTRDRAAPRGVAELAPTPLH